MVELPFTPMTFGKYELLEPLAVGGMAELFLARSASQGGVTRSCVIKRILPQHCANRQFVSMFIDEARIMIGLDHPNVVKLFDFGQIDGAYFMAMEYVDGHDLVEVLQHHADRGEALDPAAAAYTAHEMALALAHAHALKDHQGRQLNTVHRDVSPHNVLISHAGVVKLTDFGIAVAKNKLTHTRPGTVMGKFAYMSPEQAMAEPVDARSDLFAVGVVLHEMLTGQRLFRDETPVKTITNVIEAWVPEPSSIRSGVPPVLDRIALRALERDLDRRYQSGTELADDLGAYLRQHRFGREDFAAHLRGLGLEGGRAEIDARAATPVRIRTVTRRDAVDGDTRFVELLHFLAREPNVWTLAAIGERLLAMGERVRGFNALRTAAAVFVHRGFLAQAIIALEPMRHLCDGLQRRKDLFELATLRDGQRRSLMAYVERLDAAEAFELLRSAPGSGLDRDEPTVLHAPAPLFGYVNADLFVQLVERARVRHLQIGERVVREGESGASLFAVGRGRVVVYCDPPPGDGIDDDGRVYLSSLAEGDFFGEFGFLTEEPRTATVETISEVWLLELERSAVDRLIELTPEVAGALLDFYKERVTELLMAKSPVFTALDPQQRKVLLAHAALQPCVDNEVILDQGETSTAFFFIKRGEVEVFSELDGLPVFLNKLVQGDFFGEVAALRGVPRTASVRAIGDVELLRLDAGDIVELMRREPRMAEVLERAADERLAESERLLAENQDLLARL